MAVELGKGSITGITTATNDTDVAYKQYADNKPGYALTTSANEGEYYKGSIDSPGGTTAIGISSSFQYTCYNSSGSYNYPIDSSATNLNIYITAAGGGGSEGQTDFSKNTSLGFNWSSPSSCIPGSEWSNSCFDIVDNGSRVVATSLDNSSLYTSDDGGMNWIQRTLGSNYGSRGLIYANNLFVSANCYQQIMVSTDAIHWAMRTTAKANCSCNPLGVAYGNGVWFLPGCSGVAQSSTDTIHWTLRTFGSTNTSGCVRNVVYGGGQFLAHTCIAQTSTDAIHWTLRTFGQSWGCTFSTRYIDGEYFVADRSGSYSMLSKSTDAIHWEGSGELKTSRGSCGAHDITKINNGKQYLATGDGGARVSTSTDFINWITKCVTDGAIFMVDVVHLIIVGIQFINQI